MRFLRLTLPAVLAGFLCACATEPRWEATPDARDRWQAREARLNRLTTWNLDGRFGFTRKKQGFTASLAWNQAPGRYSLSLTGPLDQDIAHLEGEGGHHRITVTGRGHFESDNVEDLLDEAIGYPLPLDKLRYWVRGLPDPSATDVRTLDAQGRLSKLEDDGWTVEFLRYTRIGDTELPARINLENRWFTLKFAILDWQLDEVAAAR